MVGTISDLERDVINGTTMRVDERVRLGDIIKDLVNSSIVGAPKNFTGATSSLTFGGAVLDGDIITIGQDTYEFVASDEALSTTVNGNIAVDIFADTTQASGTLTLAVQPIAGDKVTIGTKTYTFVPVGTDTADAEISIGASLAEAQTNFVNAVSGVDVFNEPHPGVEAGPFAADVSTITARVGGSTGNLIVTTETFTSESNVFAAGTLLGGVDCTAADAAAAFITAVNTFGTESVTASDANGDVVTLTSALGSAGNDIQIGFSVGGVSTTANFTGGVDGTLSPGLAFRVDGTNLYVSIAENKATGTNWRKIALSAL